MRSGRVRYRDGLLGQRISIAQAALAFLGTLAALVCHAADSPATSGAGVTGATVRLLVHDTLTRQIELVVARPEIGSAIDRNKRERVHIDDSELRNLVVSADLIVRSALKRKESRGLHFSRDYPAVLPKARDTILRPSRPRKI